MKKFALFAIMVMCTVSLYGCEKSEKETANNNISSENESIIFASESLTSMNYNQSFLSAGTDSVISESKNSSTFSNLSQNSAAVSVPDKENVSSVTPIYPNDSNWITPQALYCINNELYTLKEHIQAEAQIVKINLSSHSVQVLAEHCSTSMLVYQNRIYYTQIDTQSQCQNIYCMNLDGSKKEQLTAENSSSFSIYKNKIYYLSSSVRNNDNSLYRMDLNGQNKTALDCNGTYITISDDRIYYSYNNKIYSVKLDGSDKKVCDTNNDTFILYANSDIVYSFQDGHEGMTLHRKWLKNGKVETLCTVNGSQFTFHDNNIYYIDFETGALFRMRTDGSEKQQMLSSDIQSYSLQNGYLYAWGMPSADGEILYRKNLKTGAEDQFWIEDLYHNLTDFTDKNPSGDFTAWQAPYHPEQIIGDCKEYVESKKFYWVDKIETDTVKAFKRFHTYESAAGKSLKEQVLSYITANVVSGVGRSFSVSVEPDSNRTGEYYITVWVLHGTY